MLREFLSQNELWCATTSKLIDQLNVHCSIGSRWFLWGYWVVNALFNHFFRVILAWIFVATTCWSSRALVSRNHTCILTLNTSIEWCLWQAFCNNWQNLEETSTNVFGPIIYRVRWQAQSHKTLCGALLFHATSAITGHQYKRFDSPACFNEISSLIGKSLLCES